MREIAPDRSNYLFAYHLCANCGKAASDLHEIARGAHREQAIAYPQSWLSVCRKCHDGPIGGMSIADQLALKFFQSPELYDRCIVNAIRGRAVNAVDELEVLKAVAEVARERA